MAFSPDGTRIVTAADGGPDSRGGDWCGTARADRHALLDLKGHTELR